MISDYGEGSNLSEKERGKEEVFHIGEYDLAGTPNFMDPILYQSFLKYKNRKNKRDNTRPKALVDLFKTDIYSMGLSLLNAAAGKLMKSINSSMYKFQDCYRTVHKLALPM